MAIWQLRTIRAVLSLIALAAAVATVAGLPAASSAQQQRAADAVGVSATGGSGLPVPRFISLK
jgi:SH3-like domain-containing protein